MNRKFTVAELRRLKNITQRKAAKHIGITMNGYRFKEIGASRFYVDEALKLCELFGVNISDINWDVPRPARKGVGSQK